MFPLPSRLLCAAVFFVPLAACTTLPLPRDAALSQKPTTARISEILASPDRSAADRANDVRRKPAMMLDFIGIKPRMTVLDLSAGGGYTTELMARAVGPTGRVYGQSAPPAASQANKAPAAPEGATSAATTSPAADKSATAAPVRKSAFDALTARAKNTGLTNIIPVVRPFENPVPEQVEVGQLDLATLMFNYHDVGHLGVDRSRMNSAIFKALKPGGMYVVADHAGRRGTGISESGTLHRIEEDFLRREIEQAGFVVAAEGNFLRNPDDPRDRNTPLPPQTKDDFVLKFVKP